MVWIILIDEGSTSLETIILPGVFIQSLVEKFIIRKAVVYNFIQDVELKSLIFYLNYTE